MSVWTIRRRKLWSLAPVFVAVLLLIASGASAEQYPQSTLHPKGDFARMVDGVFTTTVKWAAVVFVLVEGALIWTIIRFRGKPTDPEPKQVHGHTMAEIIWTAIPAVILAFIAVPTIQTIFKTYERPAGNALEVEVIGHQWWWEFHYPQFGVTTANELHVPVGRPVVLKMTTKDVLHSFWLPQIAAKRDVFPNRNTMLWFTAEEAGNYSGQCAEFCGIQHGKMGFRVVASPPDEFDTYIKEMLATGAPKPVADSAKATAAAGLEVATLAATTAAAAQRPA
ncbi:MAG: cytochrome c oxidase subunit II, partial [Gemmatimonadota bacterium]